MDFGINGRRAAVGGASKGLGYGAAAALVAEGVRVAICGRDKAAVDAAATRLGPNAVGLVADVSDSASGVAFVKAAAEALGGPIEILVANTGGPPPGTFKTTKPESYLPAIELSLMSTVGMCQAAVPAMQAAKWGRVVAITSISVRQPIAALMLSNTARAGVTGFLKTLAREIAADGVTVNSLQPGSHATDRIKQIYGGNLADAGPMGDPADFGSFVAFLCSEQAKFVTGAHIQVDGGAYAALL